jgi:hypothetical protein
MAPSPSAIAIMSSKSNDFADSASGASVLILGIELSKGYFFGRFQLTQKVLTDH